MLVKVICNFMVYNELMKDTRTAQYIGTFSPLLNQYFNNKESLQNSQLNQKANDSISAFCEYSNDSIV